MSLLLLVTSILHPWRNSVSQDDATYSVNALLLAQGQLIAHPLNLAGAWPQILLGGFFVWLFPSLPALPLLNSLTWVVFCWLVATFSRRSNWDLSVVSCFFLFPIWLQYGASFLTEVYGATLLFCLWEALRKKSRAAMFFLSALAGLQQQTLFAFPTFWGLASCLSGHWHRNWKEVQLGCCLLLGVVLGFIVYQFLPVTPLQQGFLQVLLKDWSFLGFVQGFYSFLVVFLQVLLALGIFLIPFLELRTLSSRRSVLIVTFQAIFFLILFRSEESVLSAGILFTGYLPRTANACFLSMGIWGWIAGGQTIRNRLSTEQGAMVRSTFVAVVMICLFCTFRRIVDIRYMMIPAFSLALLWVRSETRQQWIGSRSWVSVPLLFFSILANQYNLNTTEARWQVARFLESRGIPKEEISSGYGRDLFEFGLSCTQHALAKFRGHTDDGSLDLESAETIRRFFRRGTRIYEDEWRSRYLVKPAKFFGKKLNLNQNVRPGQDSTRKELFPYSVLGIGGNELAIINTGAFERAWCYR